MKRGTNVGQAYVSLSVDGTGLNEDIADEFDKFDSTGFAERHGQAYRNAFLKQMSGLDKSLDEAFAKINTTSAGRRLQSDIARAFETEDAMAVSVRKQVLSAFKRGAFDDLMKRAGREAGDSFGTEFDVAVKNAVLESVERSMLEAARAGRDVQFTRGVDRSGAGALTLPGSDANAAVEAARAAGEAARAERQARMESLADRIRTEQAALDDYNSKQRERRKIADQEFADTADRIEEIGRLWEQMDNEAAENQRKAFQKVADRLATQAKIEQRRRDELNEYNRRELAERLEGERALAAAAKARNDDDRQFLRFQQSAVRLLRNVRFDPRIDQSVIRKFGDDLRDNLEKRQDLRLQLKGDLSEREKAKIKAELAALDAKIRVDIDEDAINRALLRAQGVSGNRDQDRDIGSTIGRLLGAGSRNNFLNIIGKSIGGLVSLTAKAAKGAKTLFDNFRAGFTSLEQGASFGQKFLAGFDNSIGKIGASLPSIAIGVAVVTAALSVLASVLSALVAIITALAATITSALAGAFTVLGGSILAVVAAAGLLTAAFTSMTDVQKKAMAETFGPVKDTLIGIGQVVLRDLIPAFATWAQNLQTAFALLGPLAQVMGKAFGAAGSILTEALSGPGFRNFAQALGEFLPSIVTRLSSALGGFLNGMLGLFSAVLPFVNQFAGYLDRVATNFSKWANSAQGQNAITDFVERALASLRSLWNFTREFFGFLGDVLFSPEAQKAGNSMFDSLARSFRGFRDAIKRAQADGSLDRWFKSAAEFAGDLKVLLIGLKDVFKTLVSSQTLKNLGEFLRVIGKILTAIVKLDRELKDFKVDLKGSLGPLGQVVDIVSDATNPFKLVSRAVGTFSDSLNRARGDTDNLGRTITAMTENALVRIGALTRQFEAARSVWAGITSAASSVIDSISFSVGSASGPDLAGVGARSPQGYRNPYVAFANSLIKDGPGIALQIRQAMRSVNQQIANALAQAGSATDGVAVRDSLLGVYQQVRERGTALVESAQQALNSAAQRLASASSAREASRALAAVRRAQAGLRTAIAEQRKINRAAEILNQQRVLRPEAVARLVDGLRVQNATLAEYAAARGRLAQMISDQSQRLADAIALRDDFKKQITDSIKSFGSLVSATASTVNGVAQALTANDVVSNLEDRLEQIRKFQENLRILLAQGLSNEAYKQLLEAGVDGGSATAEALVKGGQSAIDAVNSLLSQIGYEADTLGGAASNRMYQAGVDIAQGLLDGLKSVDAQLAAMSARLGATIANAIKDALGIRSPSVVAKNLMGYWGDGLIEGLDAQQGRVGVASSRLAGSVAVSPEVAAYASRQGASGVSGNGEKNFDLTVITPTEDPQAVVVEVMNEITGRL